jgi:hypothetical protein
VDFEEER